jgi:hypothetical protein
MAKQVRYKLCEDCKVAAANDDYSGADENQVMRTRAGLKRVGYLAFESYTGPHSFECDICANRPYESNMATFLGTKYEERSWKHTSQHSCSDDGLWMRRVDANTMAIVEFEYWENLDSSAIETYGKYNVQCGTVELDNRDLNSALSYIGLRILDNGHLEVIGQGNTIAPTDASYAYAIAEALWSYGAKDVSHDESGNNQRKLMRIGKSFAA